MALNFEHHGFSHSVLETRSEKETKLRLSRRFLKEDLTAREMNISSRRGAVRFSSSTKLKRMCGMREERMNKNK